MNHVDERLKDLIKTGVSKLTHVGKVEFAIYCAEQVNSTPQLAIDAAKAFIKSPNTENIEKCKSAATDTIALVAESDDATALFSAAYASYVASYTNPDHATSDAAGSAYAALASPKREESLKENILSFLLELESGTSGLAQD